MEECLSLQKIEKQAKQLLAEHELAQRGWTFRFDRAKNRAGCCHFKKKHISLSYFFCKVAPSEEVLNTLLHEIAHALVGPGHNHDWVWHMKSREIGCDGMVTHNLSFCEMRYRLGCSRGCWQVPRHRINRKWVRCNRCGNCGAELTVLDSRVDLKEKKFYLTCA